MCNPQALERLKPLQLKPKPLYCTGSNNCWCAKITFILPLPKVTQMCMSPTEMLKQPGLSQEDVKYLETLKHREFIY